MIKRESPMSIQDVMKDMEYIMHRIDYILSSKMNLDDLDQPYYWAVEIQAHAEQLLEDMKNAVNHAKAIAVNREKIRRVK